MRAWRETFAANGRWYVGMGTWLLLFAFFDFVLGWDAYRSNLAAYFPSTVVVVLSFSAPSRLRERLATSGSAGGVLTSWWPYLAGFASFAVLFTLFSMAGWPSRRLAAAAYLAMGILMGCLAGEGQFRTSFLVALLTTRLSSRKPS